MDDVKLARYLAQGAGDLLLSIREKGDLTGKELGKAGDFEANQWLTAELAKHRPHDGILSEEMRDTPTRLTKSRVWIIDPVDGTREYGEARNDWAVHIGMAVDGDAHLGAVALPAIGLILDSETARAPSELGDPLRLVVSRTRPAAEAVMVAEALGAILVPMGSAGAKAMAVVRGEADIYLHSGGQYEWDSCAPVAVAKGAGLHCSRLDGRPLRYNQSDVSLPDLLICHHQMADQIFSLL